MKYLVKVEIERLPKEVQEVVYKTLKSYDEVHIVYENGEYHVNTYVGLFASYSSDYKYIGDVRKDDVFTLEEQIINYMEAFHDYHPCYKGKKDYQMVNSLTGQWNAKFKLNEEGNLVRVA